jgi:uncharacterized protein YqeY
MNIPRLDADLKEALLARDTLRVELLRGLKAAVLNEAIANRTKSEEVDIAKVVHKEIKKRDQAIELYKSAGRTELADKETKEKELLQAYLPTQLSKAELTEEVKKAIVATNATSIQAMGGVMKHLQQELGTGSYDSAQLAAIVKQLLG